MLGEVSAETFKVAMQDRGYDIYSLPQDSGASPERKVTYYRSRGQLSGLGSFFAAFHYETVIFDPDSQRVSFSSFWVPVVGELCTPGCVVEDTPMPIGQFFREINQHCGDVVQPPAQLPQTPQRGWVKKLLPRKAGPA